MAKSESAPKVLTGNDLAIAWFAALHAIGWWREMKPRTAYTRKEQRKFEKLRDKLSAISDHAYPYAQKHEDICFPDYGDEPLMRIDAAVLRKTRASAHKFNKES